MRARVAAPLLVLLCAIVARPLEAPAAYPTEGPRLVGAELAGLAQTHHVLRRTLDREESRLESTCEFADIRDRLIEVRDTAVTAIGRLGSLWREGRLRSGGVALAEVLLQELGAVVDDARRDIAVADSLALILAEPDDRADVARRVVAIHAEALLCASAPPPPATADQARVSGSK